MPYIKKENKEIFKDVNPVVTNAGELNYVITKIILTYINSHDKINYKLLNECIGVLECAKQELYRRLISDYEDHKIKENGDVYK